MSITNSAQGLTLRSVGAGLSPIVMLGDSRTFMANWATLGPYPFVNGGFGGFTFKNMLDQWNTTLKPPLTNFNRPAGFIIAFGINDLSSAPGTPDYINLAANISALVQACGLVSPNVILCTAMPREVGYLVPDIVLAEAPYTARINQQIRQVGVNGKVPLLDLAVAFSKPDGTAMTGATQDGTHPSHDTMVATKAYLDAAVWKFIGPGYCIPAGLPSLPAIGPLS